MLEFKQVSAIVTDHDEPGTVRAKFATLGVPDKDGDVFLPGAIPTDVRVPISTWNHGSTLGPALPIGVGTVTVDGNDAILTGRLFLSTQAGKEAYETLKLLGDLAQWSFGFTVLESHPGQQDVRRLITKVAIHEVSPVMVGAGVGTQTLAIKGETVELKGVVPRDVSKETAPEDTPWSAPTLADFTDTPWDELSAADKRAIAGHFAWAPKMPPDRYTDLKLPHHDPKTGQVVWRGVAAAMAALLGARGGVDLPAEDVPRVYAHLAAHYRQFNREPPPLEGKAWLAEILGAALDPGDERLTLADHVERVLADAAGVGARMKALAALRVKEGRVLSTANRQRLATLLEHLQTVITDLEQLLKETEPAPKADQAKALALTARTLALKTRVLTLH